MATVDDINDQIEANDSAAQDAADEAERKRQELEAARDAQQQADEHEAAANNDEG